MNGPEEIDLIRVPTGTLAALHRVLNREHGGARAAGLIRDIASPGVAGTMTPEQALARVQQLEKKMYQHARDLEFEEAARLRAQQTETYRALARLKLDALARDEVVGRLDSAERAVELKLDEAALGRLSEIFPGRKTAPEDYAW